MMRNRKMLMIRRYGDTAWASRTDQRKLGLKGYKVHKTAIVLA